MERRITHHLSSLLGSLTRILCSEFRILTMVERWMHSNEFYGDLWLSSVHIIRFEIIEMLQPPRIPRSSIYHVPSSSIILNLARSARRFISDFHKHERQARLKLHDLRALESHFAQNFRFSSLISYLNRTLSVILKK